MVHFKNSNSICSRAHTAAVKLLGFSSEMDGGALGEVVSLLTDLDKDPLFKNRGISTGDAPGSRVFTPI